MIPLFNNIFVKPIDQSVSDGGIIIPNNDPAILKGEVTGAGKDCKEVKVGDVVFWNKGTAQKCPVNGEDLFFMEEINVKAKE